MFMLLSQIGISKITNLVLARFTTGQKDWRNVVSGLSSRNAFAYSQKMPRFYAACNADAVK